MRKFVLFFLIFCFTFVISCSKTENITPFEHLEVYIKLWEQQDFSQMYEWLTEDAKANYDTESFVDRYTKVYNDLEVDDLHITYEEIEYDHNENKLAIPLDVSMDSIAGEIAFSYEINLERYVKEKDKQEEILWLVDWDPGLIFPELADGGKIRIERTEPERGEILDRNDMPLAINDIAYKVGVVPEKFVNKETEIKEIANLLHLSTESIKQEIEADWVQPNHFVPLRDVPKSDEDTLEKLRTIPSVSMQETSGRTYPSSEAIAHLIGYVGKITEEELKEIDDNSYSEEDLIGKRGLEKLYETELRGEAGVKILIEKEGETDEPIYTTLAEKEVVHGKKLQLTIDINLQEFIYEEFEGKLKGTAVALHPKTGEILALVNSPSFDPLPLTYGISQSEWEKLMNDKNQPFVNRYAATYAPGSVLKPVFAAIGLENGTITHEEKIEIEGLTWKKDNWKDYHVTRVSTSDGPVDLEDALVRSDNIYFAMKAIEMGNKKMVEGFKAFGFNEELPISLPIKQSQISNTGTLEDEILRANTSYGQGEIEVSVLHLALLYSPIINDGNIVKPILLTSEQKGEQWKENILSEKHTKKLNSYLRKVVTKGTASKLKDLDVAISGKTGTAELKVTRDTKGSENGWFVGYPTESEDLIVAMLIEEIEELGTSTFVAEKVANIIEQYEKLK